MITTIISLSLLLYIIYDFKKGFILFGTFFFFLKYFPTGIGNLSLSFAASLLLLFVFIVKRNKHKIEPVPRPVIITSFIMAGCWLITEFVSGFMNLSGWLNLVTTSFVFPWIMWQAIRSKEDTVRFIKAFVLSFLIIEIYGVFQEFTSTNPIYAMLNPDVSSTSSYRFGLVRINSILGFSSTFGVFSMFSYYIFTRLYKRSLYFKAANGRPPSLLFNYKTYVILSVFGVICCATRSCYIMFVVLSIFVILDNLDNKPSRKKMILSIACISIITIYFIGFSDLISDLIYKLDNSAKGSSSEMRENQLEISLYWMKDSPIWGNGRNFIFKEVARFDEKIYGAESLWFRLLVDYGIAGCVTYILWVISICIVLWRYNRYYIAIPLTLFIGKTTSILIDVDFEYFLWMSIVIIKCHQYLFIKNRPYHTDLSLYKI